MKIAKMTPEALEAFAAELASDPRGLARLALSTSSPSTRDHAAKLAARAVAAAPDDPETRAIAWQVLKRTVPHYHFDIVADAARNDAYEAALRAAIRPDSTVLDIGTGTGLLAMMAARAGAKRVVTCEMNPVVAEAAVKIVAMNGLSDRIHVLAKKSTDIDLHADLGGPVDVVVSEIHSNQMVHQGALPTLADAAHRLLKPGGRMIPARGTVRVALAHYPHPPVTPMGRVSGFDLSAFNDLAPAIKFLDQNNCDLVVMGEPQDLFAWDFQSGGPFPNQTTEVALTSSGGLVSGVIQWISLGLNASITYENRPTADANSCWSILFYPFLSPRATNPGDTVVIGGAHDGLDLWVWGKTAQP